MEAISIKQKVRNYSSHKVFLKKHVFNDKYNQLKDQMKNKIKNS